MSQLKPLSEITEKVQFLAKSKAGDSIMTGREFVEAYGRSGQPLDSEPNRTIATAGGDVQTAYSKLHSVYMRVKNEKEAPANEFKISTENTHSLNTKVICADLEIAATKLSEAATKMQNVDASLASELQKISEDILNHKSRISSTGIVVLN